jgi:hypothetical protein
LSHKSGTVIVRMTSTEATDPINAVEAEIDVSGKTPEEAAAVIRRVLKKIEQMSSDGD